MALILLVDDDDPFRQVLRKMLERMKHSVVEARDGNEALKLAREQKPELVITDLVMPEKEGLETIHDLGKEFPGLPIIAMSGGGRNQPASYLSFASRMGAVGVLAKPFSNQELAAAIAEALG